MAVIDLGELVPFEGTEPDGPDLRPESIMEEQPPPWVAMELDPDEDSKGYLDRCRYCTCQLYLPEELGLRGAELVCLRCRAWVRMKQDERFQPYLRQAKDELRLIERHRPSGYPPVNNFHNMREVESSMDFTKPFGS